MSDLQELFARLKNQHTQAAQNTSAQYQNPSVSSPLFSPPIHTPDPNHSSNIISPVNPSSTIGTPGPDPSRTNNLLNLLKFNGQPGQQQGQAASPMANLQNIGVNRSTSMHGVANIQSRETSTPRPLSAADLMSNLQRNKSSSSSPMATHSAEKPETQATSSASQQDFLLNLLTKPKSQQSTVQPLGEGRPPAYEQVVKHDPDVEALTRELAQTAVDNASQARSQREPTPARQFGSPAASSSPFEAPQPTKASMFNYVNPFDQLNSSSPLNRTPRPEQQAEVAQAVQPKKIEILKHNRESSSNGGDSAAPASKSRKIGSEDTPSSSIPEAKGQQSVSEALEDVGEKVDKQVEQALADADTKTTKTPKKSVPSHIGNAASDEPRVKKETAAEDEVESSWESAEDDHDKDVKVEVYNFPMKPFVSIQVKPSASPRPIRQDNFMVIAQLKKEFDQIDRSLVTASQTHIVYAQVATKKDNGGFRIIRQDSGDHKQVFRSSGERIFSVQLCNSIASADDVESVLGTGVSGSVFWTSLAKSRGDLFADDDVEAQGFIMPPVQTAEENTSGSPVKTRAKMSARHPEFFAVARGKQIFIVSPDTVKDDPYCDKDTRKVNSERFFNDHSLKINTGKAGKDFCFSEDDSVIVSLDKNGRFKFWDVRELTARAGKYTEGREEPLELKEPVWTLMAGASGGKPEEKPSVSSIMFLDKERPFNKGSALRYMIIGFKQNHILQLWDLGLGKAVQEIRLPHEKDSDGICSLNYHPKTGIVAVGHPTRNSIYFIHLSAPKYNIPQMEQARYISMLATQDPALPKPDSTAIMSGLREFSFAKVGQLRSVDMLRTPVENASERNSAEETLFELYVMHSKGVVGISIKRDDLGWDAQSKMVNPKDGVKEGVLEVSELIQPPKVAATPEATPVLETSSATKTAPKPAILKKADATKQPAPAKVEIKKEPSPSPARPTAIANRLASPEPPSKPLPQVPAFQPAAASDNYALAAQRAKSPVKSTAPTEAKKVLSPPVARASVATTSSTDSGELQGFLNKHFDTLYQRIDADKRIQDAAGAAKQDALLRLVSSTLTENVDRSLSEIIASRIQQDVIPTLTEVTSKVAAQKIGEILPQQLNASVAAAMKATLSNTLQQALKDKEVQRTISEVTATSVSQKVQQQVSTILQQNLPGMATQAAQKMVADLEKRLSQQQIAAESRRQQDNAKIEELSNIIRSLSTTVQSMAASQSAFQEQILEMQRESRTAAAVSTLAPAPGEPEPEPQDPEVAEMTKMLLDKDYEQVTIKWISSDHQAELFDNLFVRVNPAYLQHVSPLVALTVSAAITSSFDTYVDQRLEWLGRVLNQIDIRDDDIRDVAPKIMDVLSQRLQGAYMALSEEQSNHPLLKTISALNRQVNEIRRLAQ